jgi:hypothetical protein
LQYAVSVYSAPGAYPAVTDLKIDYETVDPNLGSVMMEYSNSAIAPPNNNLQDFGETPVFSRWHWKGLASSSGFEYSVFNLTPGLTRTAYVYALPYYAAGQTVTAQVSLRSATWPQTAVAQAQTYILSGIPTQTPNVPTPTPVVAQGKIVTYPQPAKDKMCFAYYAPAAGAVEIVVYNAAFQVVARVKDTAVGGAMETSCIDVTGFANGVYYYKAKAGDFSFGLQNFGIVH